MHTSTQQHYPHYISPVAKQGGSPSLPWRGMRSRRLLRAWVLRSTAAMKGALFEQGGLPRATEVREEIWSIRGGLWKSPSWSQGLRMWQCYSWAFLRRGLIPLDTGWPWTVLCEFGTRYFIGLPYVLSNCGQLEPSTFASAFLISAICFQTISKSTFLITAEQHCFHIVPDSHVQQIQHDYVWRLLWHSFTQPLDDILSGRECVCLGYPSVHRARESRHVLIRVGFDSLQ